MKTSHDLHAKPQGALARITAHTPAGRDWLRRACGFTTPGACPGGLLVSAERVWQTLNEARDLGLVVETGLTLAEQFADETPAPREPSPVSELFAIFRDCHKFRGGFFA